MFHEKQFRIAFSQRRKGKWIYRIAEKDVFEKAYQSFVDVQAIQKVNEGIKYITKYLSKSQYEAKSQILTLTLCWIFRKRFFAVSGDFHSIIYAKLKISSQFIQTNRFGNEIISRAKWVLIGIYSADLLGIISSVWFLNINLNNYKIFWKETEKFAELVRKKGCVA